MNQAGTTRWVRCGVAGLAAFAGAFALTAGAVFVCDPDGTLIELVQAPGDVEAPPGG